MDEFFAAIHRQHKAETEADRERERVTAQ
jgi:hypothetical protein